MCVNALAWAMVHRDGLPVAGAVVLVAVLAGCSALGPAESRPTRAETVTAVPLDQEPTTPTRTVLARGGTGVPGIDGATVTDVEALLSAHVRYLANHSYRLVWVRRAAGGSGRAANEFRKEFAVENDSRFRVGIDETPASGETENRILYVDRSGLYRRVLEPSASSEAIAGAVEVTARERYATHPLPFVGSVLETGAVDGDVVTHEGTRYTRLVVRSTPPYLERAYTDYEVRRFAATVWVHPDGYLRSVHYEYTLSGAGERVAVEGRYTYADVGTTTVPEPAWVTQLKADIGEEPVGTVERPNETADDGTATPTQAD